ncbi:hypothetical protein GCM10023219_21690 [Stakelama sediminis]|uniref:PilZ domain-containing protein n=1 Tax=Stakelama sediminis TaxID=463200 RepID=A0A840YZT2_9SPHN|nr:PilZ domain-containing protein [Stakelama sediminis]MBB5719125.1 hypothetical protein [Stakelama sediminis]
MASVAVAYDTTDHQPAQLRAEPRYQVLVSRASIRGHGDTAIQAELADISIYGCRITCTRKVEAGERLWLRLAGGMPVAATVIWRDEDRMGCRFDEPIERQLMRALVLGLH